MPCAKRSGGLTALERAHTLHALKPHAESWGHFVSFTDIEKVGLNPNNRFSTPIGIYAYMVPDVWDEVREGNWFFGSDRSQCHVLVPRHPEKLLQLHAYSWTDADRAYLEDVHARQGGEKFNLWLEQLHAEDPYPLKTEGSHLWAALRALSQQNDYKLKGVQTRRSAIKWNRMLREMGYEGVLDRSSNIHLLQSSQALFLSTQAFHVIHSVRNRMPSPLSPVSDGYWGSEQQPFWYPGPNHTVDMVLTRDGETEREILLVQRAIHAKGEQSKWALPGGFVDSQGRRGQPWKGGRESFKQAVLREVSEETSINLFPFASRIREVGEFNDPSRDPRNNAEAWTHTHLFQLHLEKGDSIGIPKGRDDAATAGWVGLSRLPSLDMAFDHLTLVGAALQVDLSAPHSAPQR